MPIAFLCATTSRMSPKKVPKSRKSRKSFQPTCKYVANHYDGFREWLQYTYIYDRPCTIAGEKIQILTKKGTDFVENIPVGKSAEALPITARIQGVATRRLPSTDDKHEEKLTLPYLPRDFYSPSKIMSKTYS